MCTDDTKYDEYFFKDGKKNFFELCHWFSASQVNILRKAMLPNMNFKACIYVDCSREPICDKPNILLYLAFIIKIKQMLFCILFYPLHPIVYWEKCKELCLVLKFHYEQEKVYSAISLTTELSLDHSFVISLFWNHFSVFLAIFAEFKYVNGRLSVRK